MKAYLKRTTAVLLSIVTVMSMSTTGAAKTAGYEKTPKEVMYLKGLQETYGKDGKTYNLYDINSDEVQELFVAKKTSKGDTLQLFLYDKKTKSAKKAMTYKKVSGLYKKSSKKRIVIVQKTGSDNRYTELEIKNKKLTAPVVIKATRKNGKIVYKKNKKTITKAAYKKYGKKNCTEKKQIILRTTYPWAPSNIYGVAVTLERPDEKDDFYFAANYEYISGDHIKDSDDSNSHWAVQQERVDANLKAQFEDTTKYNTDNIKRVRDYYDIATDFDKRESDGVSALKKVVDGIRACDTLSGLTGIMCDPEKNPDGVFMTLEPMEYEPDVSELCMKVYFDIKNTMFSCNPFVKMSAEDLKNSRERFDQDARYVLGRLGFEKKETDELINACYSVEDKLAEAIYKDGQTVDDDKVVPEDIVELAKKHTGFPLEAVMARYGVKTGKAMVFLPEYLSALDDYYKAENLEAIKGFLIVHNATAALGKLDVEAAALENGYTEADKVASATDTDKQNWRTELQELYKNECVDSSYGTMSTAIESAYMENFVDPDDRKRVSEMADKIKESLKELVRNATWMSESGRNSAIEKLDNMVCFIMCPDEIIDTAYLNIDKSKSYYENVSMIENNKKKHNLSFIGKPYDRNRWYYDVVPELTTTQANAMYNPTENSFMLFEGLMGGPEFYRTDMTDEEVLGKIGNVLGHEISHGLDPHGSKYDKYGNLVSTPEHPEGWFTVEDHAAYQERVKKVADYFSNIHPIPWMNYKGSKRTGEAIGDMGGMAATLGVAKTIPGFDYKKYFAAYADFWLDQSGLDDIESKIISDAHPIRYLRVNTTVQQFDEFYEAYGIKEGDGMYIDPADRIRLW